jgi:transglutaminase-like putative cysteine protease
VSLLGSAGRRLRVQHQTRYTYSGTVSASYNEARMSPRTEARQQVLESRLDIGPQGWRHDYDDYWGTAVTAFETHLPHQELTVTATTVADVAEIGEPPHTDWERLRSERIRDTFAESLTPTGRSAPPEELSALAAERVAGREPHQAAQDVCALVSESMQYSTGSTGVLTLASEAWSARRGVCQDFAHLAVGALRSVGIPARYVSGYFAPRREAEIGEAVLGESHAWIEWWSGGWYGWDPTNNHPASSRHLVVGRGRDYGDVPPLKGIVAGSGRSNLDVTVTVTILR